MRDDRRCVECGEQWPCRATVLNLKDGIPHRLPTNNGPAPVASADAGGYWDGGGRHHPPVASWETLLHQGLEACFATSGGNAQGPRSIMDFLRVAYLPAIAAAIRDTAAALDVAAVHRITCKRLIEHEPGSNQPYRWPCYEFTAAYARLSQPSSSETEPTP